MSIRIVKIRGRAYAQEVEYRWDSVKKVGKTIVMRHLGPLEPLNPERYIRVKLNKSTTNDKIKKTRKKVNTSIEKQKKSAELNKADLPQLTPPSYGVKIVLDSLRL